MASIGETLDAFTAAFNRNDLDEVMTFFAADAIYRPGDGSEHRGVDAIRAAFSPQFAGRLGAMRFDVEDLLVDEASRKATSRWVCRHDVSGSYGRHMPVVQRLALRVRYGARLGWRGVDVFHFDAGGKISGKFTYANYDRPQLRSDLGGPIDVPHVVADALHFAAKHVPAQPSMGPFPAIADAIESRAASVGAMDHSRFGPAYRSASGALHATGDALRSTGVAVWAGVATVWSAVDAVRSARVAFRSAGTAVRSASAAVRSTGVAVRSTVDALRHTALGFRRR